MRRYKMFKKKTMEELEQEKEKLEKEVEKKEEKAKVMDEIKELKQKKKDLKDGSFDWGAVKKGWGKAGKGLLNVLKETGKATTKFAERTEELEKNAKEKREKKAIFGGDVSIEEAFGMKKEGEK